MKQFALVLVMIISNLIVNAQTDTISEKDMFDYTLEELMKIEVISSTKIMERKELVPNIISVFPRKFIKNFSFNSIDELTNKHQGFFPSQDYDRRTIGFRGINEGWNNNHFLLLIDGLSYNDNL